jgi:hypothetical protein
MHPKSKEPKMTQFKFRLFLLSLILAVCACKGPPTQVTVTNNAPSASVSPQDFSLDTVLALLKSGVNDGPTLESKINDPASGINNVDIDKDGKTDYINVVEAQIPSGKKMELMAHPSSGQGPDVSIAAIKFAQGDSGVDVQAGYAPLIDPGGQYYYHDSLLANMLFAQWLFMPSRPYYVGYAPAGYAYRSRMAPTQFTQTRTTYQTQTRISPVVAAPRPASFNAARLTTPPRAASTNFGQAAQGTSNFAVDNRQKSAGTAFGGTSTPRSAPVSAPAPAHVSAPVSRSSSPSPSRGKSR